MIKNFGGNYIDIGLIVGLNTREFMNYDGDNKKTDYIIEIFLVGALQFIPLVYSSKESRDNCADSIKEEVNKYKESNKEKGYIEGFKDGCEYALKLKG